MIKSILEDRYRHEALRARFNNERFSRLRCPYNYLQMASELIKPNEQSSRVPYNRLIYGLSATESKRQYPKRLEVFPNFIYMDDGYSLEERLYKFIREQSRTQNGSKIH